jgi:hypothetical protein
MRVLRFALKPFLETEVCPNPVTFWMQVQDLLGGTHPTRMKLSGHLVPRLESDKRVAVIYSSLRKLLKITMKTTAGSMQGSAFHPAPRLFPT